LGSTIALVDSNGNIQTSYTYDPYGSTSVTGTSNGNEFQYTGRENEGNGLYFYRARYYSPLLGRFISEDPLGFLGSGPNLYGYALDDPINLIDPSGMQTLLGSAPATTPPVTTPYPGTPSPAQVAEAVQSVERATAAAEAGTTTTAELGTGFGAEVETGAAGGPIGVAALGVVGAGATAYYGAQATIAVHHENQAYDSELDAVHQYNLAILSHPRPLPLAGRKDENSKELKLCKLAAEFELPSGQVSCAYKCAHWPSDLISVRCDPGQKCKAEIPGGWVSKETACE
jgi:RHS repeat-associated protein